jgi:hypothetical protein
LLDSSVASDGGAFGHVSRGRAAEAVASLPGAKTKRSSNQSPGLPKNTECREEQHEARDATVGLRDQDVHGRIAPSGCSRTPPGLDDALHPEVLVLSKRPDHLQDLLDAPVVPGRTVIAAPIDRSSDRSGGRSSIAVVDGSDSEPTISGEP